MFYIIYKTMNLINNKFYIGMHQTNNLDDGYLGSGRYLKRAIKKYGIENFKKEIIFNFETEQEMKNKEKEILTEEFLENNKNICYNLCVGGKGGFNYLNRTGKNIYKKHKEQTIINFKKGTEKFKELMRDKKSEWYKNHCKKISESIRKCDRKYIGRPHSEETKKKISLVKKGKRKGIENSQFGTFWITNGKENKKCKNNIPDGWYRGRKINIGV